MCILFLSQVSFLNLIYRDIFAIKASYLYFQNIFKPTRYMTDRNQAKGFFHSPVLSDSDPKLNEASKEDPF